MGAWEAKRGETRAESGTEGGNRRGEDGGGGWAGETGRRRAGEGRRKTETPDKAASAAYGPLYCDCKSSQESALATLLIPPSLQTFQSCRAEEGRVASNARP